MKSLVEINTEKKNGAFRWDEGVYHNYLEVYEDLFSKYREQDIYLFEVGFESGCGHRLWLRYFKRAKIHSIDINPFCKAVDDPRSSLDIMDVNNLTEEYFSSFQPTIAIDDGSHLVEDQVRFVKTVYPVLKEGGLLIIEDVADIERTLHLFEGLGYPFEIIDLRSKIGRYDDVLIIYRK